jgi:hypothetical protein
MKILTGFNSPVNRLDCHGHPYRHSKCDWPKTSSLCSGSILRIAGQATDPTTSGTFDPMRRTRPRRNAENHSALREQCER